MTAFVTGFPGFLGTRLVRALLEGDAERRVVVLVESKMEKTARERAAGIDSDRIEVLAGDITDRRLGLGSDDYERVAAEVTDVYHLAAVYDLAVPFDIAQKVNIDGTGNVIDLCRAAESLSRFHYVSTAYVAGDRHGVVYEHELVMGQGFKNHYESTKFQAEVWVRESMHDVPTTIYRPAIVVGDSKSGETQKFDGPYYMLRVVSRSAKLNTPIPQFGQAAAPFNVVPVDFVIDALTAAASDDKLVNRTLHLVDPEPVTASEILEQFAKEYAGKEPAFRLPPRAVASSLRLKPVRAAFGGAPRESIQYLNHAVRFDTRTARDRLEPLGVRCPRLDEYVGPLVSFFKEHEDDPSFAPGG